MTHNNRADEIRLRLQQAFSPSHLEVIDESDKHIGHAGHQGGGRHFAIVISAKDLATVSRVEAHRLIYAALADLIPDKVHAIRIRVLSK